MQHPTDFTNAEAQRKLNKDSAGAKQSKQRKQSTIEETVLLKQKYSKESTRQNDIEKALLRMIAA